MLEAHDNLFHGHVDHQINYLTLIDTTWITLMLNYTTY